MDDFVTFIDNSAAHDEADSRVHQAYKYRDSVAERHCTRTQGQCTTPAINIDTTQRGTEQHKARLCTYN